METPKRKCEDCVWWMGDRHEDSDMLGKCIHYTRVRSRRYTSKFDHCKNWKYWQLLPIKEGKCPS